MQELINQTENAQYKAKIKSMQMQVEGGSLSAESFQNIMDTAGEQLQTQLDNADQAFLELNDAPANSAGTGSEFSGGI